MRSVHLFVFFVLLMCTFNIWSQERQSQDTINAVLSEKIQQLDTSTLSNTANIVLLAVEVAALRSSLDRFTGLGIGIGATVTILQGFLVVLAFKAKQKP